MWALLIKRYWEVSICKETPANTPHSMFLLILIMMAYFSMLVTQWYIIDIKRATTLRLLFGGLFLLGSYAVYTYFLLTLYKKTHRFLQTMASLLMSSLIIHLFAFPLLLISAALSGANSDQTPAILFALVYLVFMMILSIWQFFVTAYIYKMALEVTIFTSIVVSFGLLAFNILNVSLWQ